jgi:hypothetical protein
VFEKEEEVKALMEVKVNAIEDADDGVDDQDETMLKLMISREYRLCNKILMVGYILSFIYIYKNGRKYVCSVCLGVKCFLKNIFCIFRCLIQPKMMIINGNHFHFDPISLFNF